MDIKDENGKVIKQLTDKLDWTLLPHESLEEIVKVLEFGAKKYHRESWKGNSKEIYTQSLYRHLVEYLKGEEFDKETGLQHVAHLACNALFIIYLNKNK